MENPALLKQFGVLRVKLLRLRSKTAFRRDRDARVAVNHGFGGLWRVLGLGLRSTFVDSYDGLGYAPAMNILPPASAVM